MSIVGVFIVCAIILFAFCLGIHYERNGRKKNSELNRENGAGVQTDEASHSKGDVSVK